MPLRWGAPPRNPRRQSLRGDLSLLRVRIFQVRRSFECTRPENPGESRQRRSAYIRTPSDKPRYARRVTAATCARNMLCPILGQIASCPHGSHLDIGKNRTREQSCLRISTHCKSCPFSDQRISSHSAPTIKRAFSSWESGHPWRWQQTGRPAGTSMNSPRHPAKSPLLPLGRPAPGPLASADGRGRRTVVCGGASCSQNRDARTGLRRGRYPNSASRSRRCS